ncbi:glutathione-regulated potassium-efflux system protein KefC [Paucibacter sp. DJ2R-2]|uniref:glutathione-regulated potassium-efflux system protein KefC n=1 Tax=Paucibacter sp. DJ2R-2 TaxID=2893558 RepID=UPI0021E4C0ED|nr:glutathione-regulated potassium-efflux system protein KefC [Paucibacter sp. DJ2R-2]MCV2423339.1 glutathione-regulated potassium-efflux system protein KefC [Paucibacter sp. DJ4R-1]MCV2438534.1 glutathione-regulated potassium-efflux system protein KefC [Paucibacter sp. DJ2R-2]
MSAAGSSWLHLPLVCLGAAVVAVPLARFLRLGSILGYLIAGVLIGPSVMGWISEPGQILEVAEFGVVLMMFLVGLELEPKRLWALRRPIFGWGSLQLFGSAALLLGLASLFGVPAGLGLVLSLGLAMSSTAVALAVLAERNLGRTTAGQSILSVALLQDIAAIPVLALVPIVAAAGVAATAADPSSGGSGWAAAKALGMVLLIVLGGRLALRPALRWIARSRTPEIFTAAALLLVIGTAALMHSVGLSMALGAFLAGVLLAESEYRRELETDLEPFKGLLLGLFFIAVGMGLELRVLREQTALVLGLLAALLLCKGLLLSFMARWMQIPVLERPVFVILLAQGGEFGFVVFQLSQQAGLIDATQSSALVAAVALSLACTPALLLLSDRLLLPRLQRRKQALPGEQEAPEPAPILIAGFGRYGQIVGRLLFAHGYEATVLDHDAEAIEAMRKFGWRVFFGDATRLDLLRSAGAAQAKVLVIAVDDMEQSLKIAELAREHFPQARVVARARHVRHYFGLRNLGVELIERETFDAALNSGRSVMEVLGLEPHAARKLAWRFRQHNIEQLEQMLPLQHDTGALIAAARQARLQLEALMAQEREQARQQQQARAGGSWSRAEKQEPELKPSKD